MKECFSIMSDNCHYGSISKIPQDCKKVQGFMTKCKKKLLCYCTYRLYYYSPKCCCDRDNLAVANSKVFGLLSLKFGDRLTYLISSRLVA